MMQTVFKQVNEAFLELGVFLSSLDLDHDLQDEEKVGQIYQAFQATSELFEKDVCSQVKVCKKCEQTRDELKALVALLKEASYHGRMSPQTAVAFTEYMYSIPQTLFEIKSMYLESLNTSQF